MKFSKKSEYALRALIELTSHYRQELVQRQEIAARQHIPLEYLEHILLSLKHAGLITSKRGVSGGYTLIKDPAHITLGQIIRLLDGPLAPISCVSKTAYQKCADCPYASTRYCPLQDVMSAVRNAVAGILDHYNLKHFTEGLGGRTKSPRRTSRS